ncbi:putative transporter [Aspergillus costaricaensis CBS 115574]|uniref:Transporter n=1 Tax=Aspergillus costaricaensis CBS 115574 TaxID=1448317 RepID=A0ACD1I0P3_9EURO|nr:putative transporter [Aspergillus costaricaensis CBS 115574]RAK84021.1 putative transporter [Aspergillus costaricaensis CBS 115574]
MQAVHVDKGFILSFTALASVALLVALDGTSISVALPIISNRLGGTAIQAFWTGTSYLLCSTVLQPSFGSLSQLFGRKPLIMLALLFFVVGAIVAATSQNFTIMIVGRSLQGVGGGGVVTLIEIIITDLVPLQLRGHYFGMIGTVLSIGSVTGPVVGGGFAERVIWRWIFYINVPIAGASLFLIPSSLKAHSSTPAPLKAKLRSIDYSGVVLFVASMTSFLIGVTWGGVIYPWRSVQTFCPIFLSMIGMILFAYHETSRAVDPIIPISIFGTPTAIVGFIGVTAHGLILSCVLYYLPFYFEAVKGYTPILAGTALLPLTFTLCPSAIIVGLLITRWGRYRWAVIIGSFLACLGSGILCIINTHTSVAGWVCLMLVPGLGLGFLFPALIYVIQTSAEPRHLTMAVAMCSFFRSLGQAVGIAIGGVIFQNCMYSNLMKYPAHVPHADEYSRDVASLVETLRMMPGSAAKEDLKTAYSDSLRIVWAVCCALAGCSALLSWLIRDYNLIADEPVREG